MHTVLSSFTCRNGGDDEYWRLELEGKKKCSKPGHGKNASM